MRVRFITRWRWPRGPATIHEAEVGQVRDLPDDYANAAIAAGAAEPVEPAPSDASAAPAAKLAPARRGRS